MSDELQAGKDSGAAVSATKEQLREVVRRIVEAFDPWRIVLFGSHAYGEPTSESDADLLVVMESDEPVAARSAGIARTLLDIPFPPDTLLQDTRFTRAAPLGRSR